jgi:hypothetical protein
MQRVGRGKFRKLALIGLAVLLVGAGAAGVWNWKRLVGAYVDYKIRGVTTALPHCDRVEVFRINGWGAIGTRAEFPFVGNVGVRGQETLSGVDAEAFAALWRSQRFDWRFQGLCHDPAYGLRFYNSGRVVFETSVCFKCSNFSTSIYGATFWGFDSKAPQSAELLHRLQALFPAPAVAKPRGD